MRNTFFLLLLLVSGLSQAQNTLDSNFIQTYPDDLQVIPSVRYYQNHISIQANQNSRLEYRQNSTAFGTRLQFDNWGIGLSIPTRLLSGKTNSSSFGVQLQVFPKSLMVNAGAMRMKGFQKVNLANSHVEAFYPENQDMQLIHLYANPIYVFSKRKYSLRSPLQLTERQIKSRGSLLAALRVEYLRLKSNSNIIEQNHLNSVLTDYVFRQNGVEAGYTYTQVIAKDFFISAIAMGGLAHTRTGYQQDNSKYHFKKWQWIPLSDMTLSIGYQSDRYFSSFQVNYRNRPIHSDEVQMEVNGLMVQLLFGIRLHAPRLRRIVDQRSSNFEELFAKDR